jgi:hypothetical protein
MEALIYNLGENMKHITAFLALSFVLTSVSFASTTLNCFANRTNRHQITISDIDAYPFVTYKEPGKASVITEPDQVHLTSKVIAVSVSIANKKDAIELVLVKVSKGVYEGKLLTAKGTDNVQCTRK